MALSSSPDRAEELYPAPPIPPGAAAAFSCALFRRFAKGNSSITVLAEDAQVGHADFGAAKQVAERVRQARFGAAENGAAANSRRTRDFRHIRAARDVLDALS